MAVGRFVSVGFSGSNSVGSFDIYESSTNQSYSGITEKNQITCREWMSLFLQVVNGTSLSPRRMQKVHAIQSLRYAFSTLLLRAVRNSMKVA